MSKDDKTSLYACLQQNLCETRVSFFKAVFSSMHTATWEELLPSVIERSGLEVVFVLFASECNLIAFGHMGQVCQK